MEMLECAGFLLVDGDRFLVERRRPDKAVDPGAVAIPGGHLDAGESPMDALHRELREELGLAALRVDYIAPCCIIRRSFANCIILRFGNGPARSRITRRRPCFG